MLICKDETIDLVLSAVLSRGHVLIEDVPGIERLHLSGHWLHRLAARFNASSLLLT